MFKVKKQERVFKSSVAVVAIFAIVLSVYLIFAAPTAYFSSDSLNLSIDEDNYTLLNISVNNTDSGVAGNITRINITVDSSFVLVNGSDATSKAGTYTFTNISTVYSFSASNLSSNGDQDYFEVNISVKTPGTYVLNISLHNGTAGNNELVFNSSITLTVNDTISGDVGFGGLTDANDIAFNRTFIYVNVTANQANENAIVFELHNSSGIVNTTTYTDGTRTHNWTTEIGDGSFTYNVTINDSNGDTNTSVPRTIHLDSKNPTITASCDATDNQYTEGDDIVCSCSSGDDVNASMIVTTGSVSTDVTGTFTFSCSVRDGVPNNASASLFYTINPYPSSLASSAGGASTIKKTFILGEDDFGSGYTKELGINERFKFSVDSRSHFALVKEVTSQTVKIEVSSSHVQTATLQIGDLRKFDVTDDGYYDVSVKLNSISNNKADLTILSINELITESLEEQQRESDTEAEKVGEDAKAVDDAEGGGSLTWLWILIGLVVVVVVVVVIVIIRSRKEK